MNGMMQKAHPVITGELTMFRKLALTIVAAAALGTAALAPTSASAWHGGWRGHYGGWHGGGWGYRYAGYRAYGYGYGNGWCYRHPYACY
jgi:hypothetical protein